MSHDLAIVPLSASRFDGWVHRFRLVWLRRLAPVRVVMAVSDKGLVCIWESQKQWFCVDAVWPDGSCHQGLPVQSEAIADLIADLLLDLDLQGASIDLLLPLELCDWNFVDGLPPSAGIQQQVSVLQAMPWSAPIDHFYVSSSECSESTMAVAVARSDLDAWINVFDLADLPLNRVDWQLSAAFKGLMKRLPKTSIDLVWSIASAGHERLLLIRNGVPEVDQAFDAGSSLSSDLIAIHDLVSAWRSLRPVDTPVHWLQTGTSNSAPTSGAFLQNDDTDSLIPVPSEQLMPLDPAAPPELLDDLVSLAFEGLDLKL